MPTKIIQKKDGECYGCKRTLRKRDNFTLRRKMYVCNMCGYTNGSTIFEERIEIEKQELIFGNPIK